jgi:hypothetical protein
MLRIGGTFGRLRPLPPVLAFDPHRGLVGADHGVGEHDVLDCRRGIQQRLAGAGQDVADRTLTDRQGEQFVHQQGQSFHAYGMGVMQIDHHRGDGVAERRSLFQTGRSLGGHPLAATGATAAEQADLGHVGPNGWQFDTLIDLLRGLRRVGKDRLALRAGAQQPVDRSIRVRMQRPADAGAAFARRAIRRRGRKVLLLALRWRLRRIAGGLRWATEHAKEGA